MTEPLDNLIALFTELSTEYDGDIAKAYRRAATVVENFKVQIANNQ